MSVLEQLDEFRKSLKSLIVFVKNKTRGEINIDELKQVSERVIMNQRNENYSERELELLKDFMRLIAEKTIDEVLKSE